MTFVLEALELLCYDWHLCDYCIIMCCCYGSFQAIGHNVVFPVFKNKS